MPNTINLYFKKSRLRVDFYSKNRGMQGGSAIAKEKIKIIVSTKEKEDHHHHSSFQLLLRLPK